jgi:long-chain acyl-CoA synthetase
MLPNCPQYVIAAFAILRLGAVVVNINPSYTAREALNVAVDSGIRILITLDALAPLVLAVKDQTAIERIIITSLAEYAEPPGPAPRVAGTESLAEILGTHKPGVFRVAISRTLPSFSTPVARPARRKVRC